MGSRLTFSWSWLMRYYFGNRVIEMYEGMRSDRECDREWETVLGRERTGDTARLVISTVCTRFERSWAQTTYAYMNQLNDLISLQERQFSINRRKEYAPSNARLPDNTYLVIISLQQSGRTEIGDFTTYMKATARVINLISKKRSTEILDKYI